MAKIGKKQEVAVSKLKPYEQNAKLHGADQVQKIAESIQEFGFISPILIDGEYNVIAGHGRLEAAKLLGMAKVPCVRVDGLSDAQRRAYILADNKLSELGGWDTDLVSEELKALSDEGFDIELTGFVFDDEIIDTGDIEDFGIGNEIEQMVAEPDTISNPGDLWALGDHRLLCGDSLSRDDVSRLCGKTPMDLLLTDPPYNVAVKNAKGMTIINDNMDSAAFYGFLLSAFENAAAVLRPGGVFYIWHADSEGLNFRRAVTSAGLEIKENIIWVKNHFTLGRQDYQWKHEPCLYGWKPGASHYFQKARNISTIIRTAPEPDDMSKEQLLEYIDQLVGDGTVWEEYRPQADDLHPTMKPITLIERQVKNSSRQGENVLDLFGGSGTTLMACEKLKRKCFMMEYDPKYCDVIIKRWEAETGQKAVLLD